MPEPRSTTLFEDAVDIPVWLEADARLPLAERTRRDRAIGVGLGARDAVARVRGWWRAVERAPEDFAGARLEHARKWGNVLLAGIGLASGVAFALAAYRYDGMYPVNVVRVLGLLLVPQLLLLALNLLLIPGRVPGLRLAQDALASINPGALAAAAYRHVTGARRAAMFGWSPGRSSAARRFGKWQILYWSQIAAVGFNLGAVATAIAIIAFTDLAFGWSTTLDVETGTAARIVETIGAPWQWLAPGAVPDASLVERSLFFRLEGEREFADSRALTGWWSFTLLAVVVYGLLPRAVFLLLAGWRLRAATRVLLLHDPRVTALLDRMSTPNVESRPGPDGDRVAEPGGPVEAPRPRVPVTGAADAVIWNQSVAPGAAAEVVRARLGLELATVLEAGAGSLDADRAALARIAQGSSPVVLLTPAWEPPLLEFTDFVGAVREAIGPSASVIVMPVGEDAGPITALERETWSLAVQRADDPAVYLEPGDE